MQWNGQPDGHAGQVDAYNISFTNDLEPTALAECGGYQHRDDAGQLPVCDTGWGFFNLNLLAATLQAYRDSIAKAAEPTTVLRISHPPAPPTAVSPPPLIAETLLRVEWAVVGPSVSFHIAIDGNLLPTTVTNSTSMIFDLSTIPDGRHTVTVTAVDGKTTFPLARDTLDLAMVPAATYVAVTDSVTFDLKKQSANTQTVVSATVGFVNQASLYINEDSSIETEDSSIEIENLCDSLTSFPTSMARVSSRKTGLFITSSARLVGLPRWGTIT